MANIKLDSGNALKDAGISGDKKGKEHEDFGKKIVAQCDEIINSSYFTKRNQRFELNEAMAAGRMNMTKFMDFFDMNGKTNYVNISWKSIMIVNTAISRLVGRWMTKKEKAVVTAVDPISTKKKKEKVDEAEFLLYNREILEQLEAQSGVQMIPKDAYVPDDKDDLDLWAKEELRLPEEILYERGINGVLDANDWGDMGVNSRSAKHDSAVVGFVGAKTTVDASGKIHVRKCIPANCFYSYSERDDFKDADIKGEIVSYTMGQIRSLFPNLTGEEILEISKCSKQYNSSDKIAFDTGAYSQNLPLPIDDWKVDVVDFTLRSLDSDKSLIKTGRDGSLYVDKPKKRIEDLYEGNEYVEKQIWNIYHGVYVRNSKKLLQWGLMKNMPRPQDYKKIAEVKSPYSFYMYQNNKMRNIAVPEKVEEPVEQMILARLKIQQLVAGMRKSGMMYDIDGMQAMDLGNGVLKPLELMKVTDQTGNVYYRGRDAEGNRIDSPVRETPNAGSVPQLQALIQVYNYHLQVFRDEVGINEFAEGQTIKPRTGQENVQTALEISFNATDYMNDITIALKNEISSNIACYLHDAIEFGAEEYRDMMKETDVKNRDFDTKIEMLPSTEEITKFENTLNMAIGANPILALYVNPEKIKLIARENVKLANLFLQQGQKRAIRGEAEKSERMQMQNAEVQKNSAIAVEQEKQKAIAAELEMKAAITKLESESNQKDAILQMFTSIYSKGLPVPENLRALEQGIIQNMAVPLFVQNEQNAEALEQEAMMEQQAAQEEQMGQPAQQPMEMEGMEEEMA